MTPTIQANRGFLYPMAITHWARRGYCALGARWRRRWSGTVVRTSTPGVISGQNVQRTAVAPSQCRRPSDGVAARQPWRLSRRPGRPDTGQTGVELSTYSQGQMSTGTDSEVVERGIWAR